MNGIIMAIRKEITHAQNCTVGGSSQYRDGYLHGLRVAAAFLSIVTSDPTTRNTAHPHLNRLLSFLPAGHLDANPENDVTDTERELLGIALQVFRSGHEHADYLNWWLNTFGLSPEFSPEFLPDWMQPSYEEESDQLETILISEFLPRA